MLNIYFLANSFRSPEMKRQISNLTLGELVKIPILRHFVTTTHWNDRNTNLEEERIGDMDICNLDAKGGVTGLYIRRDTSW